MVETVLCIPTPGYSDNISQLLLQVCELQATDYRQEWFKRYLPKYRTSMGSSVLFLFSTIAEQESALENGEITDWWKWGL